MTHLTLTIALSHAITFLTKPLAASVPLSSLEILRRQLEIKLRDEFAPGWFPDQPQRNSITRCMTLSPEKLPHRAILSACHAARVPWSQWANALGMIDFQLFIDPGSVSVLRRGERTHRIVWSSATHSAVVFNHPVVYNDDDDIEEVFSLINRKVIVSDAWLSPTTPTFPKSVGAMQRAPAPVARLDTDFLKSRCASRMSNSSGSDDGAYESDAYSAPPSLVETASLSSVSSRASSPSPAIGNRSGKYIPPARRGMALAGNRQASSPPRPVPSKRASTEKPVAVDEAVLVDRSKAKLTVYAGKTTVMGGGVMMGRRA